MGFLVIKKEHQKSDPVDTQNLTQNVFLAEKNLVVRVDPYPIITYIEGMKYIILILILNLDLSISEVKLRHNGENCDGIANAWVDVNMKYYSERNGNPKNQGWYDSKGRLLLGWICK